MRCVCGDQKRSTYLRAMAGLERVEVRKWLRWLGYVTQMDETCIAKCQLVYKPAGGKHCGWPEEKVEYDVVVGDLKKCEL